MKKLINRNFALYALGRLVSLLGSGIQNVAIPLYILRTTGSGMAMGIFAFVELLPQLFLMPIGGVLGDNYNRKRIMVVSDVLSGIIAVLLFMTISEEGTIALPLLLGCQILLSSVMAVFDTTTSAMIPELVGEDQLLKGNSIIGSIDSMTNIAGPVIGAALFGIFGLRVIFIINGVSFLLSAASETLIAYRPERLPHEKLTVAKSIRDVKEGFNFLKKSKGITSLIMYVAVANFFGIASLAVILPYIFVEGIGFTDGQFGILQASIMVGIFVGNIILTMIAHKCSKDKIVILGLSAEALIFFIMGIFFYPRVFEALGGPGLKLMGLYMFFLVIFGISNAFLRTSLFTNIQLMIPNELRARVLSAYSFSMQFIAPIGVFAAGVALDMVEYYQLFMFCTIMITMATAIFFLKAPQESFDPGVLRKEENA